MPPKENKEPQPNQSKKANKEPQANQSKKAKNDDVSNNLEYADGRKPNEQIWHEAKDEEIRPSDNAGSKDASQNTVPMASLQVAAVLGAIQNLPETLKTLNRLLGAIEYESDGSKVLNKHMLKDIEQALQVQFNSVHVEREDYSVKLSESTVNTILQYCKENLENHKQNDMAKCESTSQVTTPEKGDCNELNETHKLDTAIDQKNLPVGGRNISEFVVQVMDPSPSGATKSFIETLRLKLANDGIHIVLTNVSEFNDDSSNTNLVITICNNHSRLHVNMENTLSGITENCCNRILLVVLHCTKKEFLPSTPSKADFQGDKYIKNVFEIVDIGFEKNDGESGIYECAMNNQAFERIRDLVRNGKLVFKSDKLCKKQKTHE